MSEMLDVSKLNKEIAEVDHSFKNLTREVKILKSLMKHEGMEEKFELNTSIMTRELVYMQHSLSAILSVAKTAIKENTVLKASLQKAVESAKQNAEEYKELISESAEKEAEESKTEEE